MAVYGQMALTTAGQALYTKAQSGTTLQFTRLQIGSGQLTGGQTPATMTALNSPIAYFSITSITTSGSTATVSGIYTNSALASSTYTCEIGLFAQDPTAGEILYAYANAGTQGDTIPPASSGPLSKQFQLAIAIGNATSVTATLASTIYVDTTSAQSVGGIKTFTSALYSNVWTYLGGSNPGATAPNGQGAYIGWNCASGQGETDFLNHHGSGGGGWHFRQWNSTTSAWDLKASIDGSGNLTAVGGTFSGAVAMNAGGTIASGQTLTNSGTITGGTINASSVPASGISGITAVANGGTGSATSPILSGLAAGTNISVTNPTAAGLGTATVGLTGVIPVANGGTGSATQNFVDLTTAQTIGGAKTFTSNILVNAAIKGNGGSGTNLPIYAPVSGWAGFTNSTFSKWLLQIAESTGAITTSGGNTLDDGTGAPTFAGIATFSNGATTFGNTQNGGLRLYEIGTSGNVKHLRTNGNHFNILNEAYSAVIFDIDDNGNITSPSTATFNYGGNTMPYLRTTNGYVEWNNGGTWQGVGGVKNVQRGSVSFAAATIWSSGNTTNVTISSVNMAKAFVTFNNLFSLTSGSGNEFIINAYLTSSTNLAITIENNAGLAFSSTLYWEVVESY